MNLTDSLIPASWLLISSRTSQHIGYSFGLFRSRNAIDGISILLICHIIVFHESHLFQSCDIGFEGLRPLFKPQRLRAKHCEC